MRGKHRLAADEEARLVLQHHVTVGVQIAQYLGGVRIVDLVPDHRRRGRLNEGGGLAGTDIETLPVNNRAIGGLDRKLRTLAAEGGVALADRAAHRVGVNQARRQATRQHQNQHRSCPRTAKVFQKINHKLITSQPLASAEPKRKRCCVKLR